MTRRDQPGESSAEQSHGHAIRATSIIGGASFINVALGLVRMKIAAVVLGPAGVGLIGILQNLLNAGATVGGLNIATSGSRQLVASETFEGSAAAANVRRAVFRTTLFMALLSGATFWLLRVPVTGLLFGDTAHAQTVGWLAVGVAATAAAAYPTAILTAARRIGDLARISIGSALAAALIGGSCIVLWGSAGILPFILAAPVATLAAGWMFLRRVPAAKSHAPDSLRPHILGLVRVGGALTISIFVSLCGQLAIRTLIDRQLGTIELGQFQAAWTITTVYLFFIFQAMGSDYLPRLTAAMGEPDKATRLVREQAEVGMLLAAPILLVMVGAAPLVLSLLYTSEFAPAQTLLRLQMIGDLVRLASWPVAFALLAGGANRDYMIADVAGTVVLVAACAWLLQFVGLEAPGAAYVIMNLLYWAAIVLLVRARLSISLSAPVHRLFLALALSCIGLFILAEIYPPAGTAAGVLAAGGWAVHGYSRLRRAGAVPRFRLSRH